MVTNEEVSRSLAAHGVDLSAGIIVLEANELRSCPRISGSTQNVDAILVRREVDEEPVWAFWPIAFDAGYVAVAHDGKDDLFLRSDLVTDLSRLGGRTRGQITMSSLGANGAFANQIFQYAYVRFYSLRLGCRMGVSEWIGETIYGVEANRPTTPFPKELRYFAFDNDDLELWRMEDPPIEANLWGYFQELPPALLPHRNLLRRMNLLRDPLRSDVTAFYARLTEGGRRPLVAVHLRRGDYVSLHREGLPWYRPVPEAWYVAWLQNVLAVTPDAVIYIATDSPETVLPAFAGFPCKSLGDFGIESTSPAIVDFEIMRRASRLAVCNSSFSRMAAILAPQEQQASLADFESEKFVPFDPWSTEPFWSRFEGVGLARASATFGYSDEARRQRDVMLRRDASTAISAAAELSDVWNRWNDLNQKLVRTSSEKSRAIARLEEVSTALAAAEKQNKRLARSIQDFKRQKQVKAEAVRRVAYNQRPDRFPYRVASKSLSFGLRILRRLLGPGSQLSKAHIEPMIVALNQYRYRDALRQGKQATRSIANRFWRRMPSTEFGAPNTSARAGPAPVSQPVPFPLSTVGSFSVKETDHLLQTLDCGHDPGQAIEDSSAEFLVFTTSAAGNEPAILDLVIALMQAESGIDAMCSSDAAEFGTLVVRRSSLTETFAPGTRPKYGVAVHEWMQLLREALATYSYGALLAGDNHPTPRALGPKHGLWSADPIRGAERLEMAIRGNSAQPSNERLPHCLVVVPWLPIGGSEVVLLEVLKGLAERWRVSIVTTLPDTHAMHDSFTEITQDIFHLGNMFDPDRVAGIIGGLAARKQSRVILTSNSGLMYERASELTAQLPTVSLVDIIHNDLPHGHFGNAVRYSAAFTTHVAISRKIGESLLERGVPPWRIRQIPNGVDLKVFAASHDRNRLRDKLGAGPGDILLGFVGRLSGEKRPERFLDVVARLAGTMPVQAVMIGSGREEAQIRKRVEDSDLRVVVRPKVERTDLPAFYAALDFLVMTSTIEGMPLVALEALACGTPVASTLVGDIGRIVTDGGNGFLSPIDDVELLADKIQQAVRDGRTEAMRANAAESVAASGMTSSAMREGYVRLFREFEGSP